MISIKFDSDHTAETTVEGLAGGLREIVAQAMDTADVFVYLDRSKSLGADPLEVFVQVNKDKTDSVDELLDTIATGLRAWKAKEDFTDPINLNILPVEWYHKIGI